MAADDLALQIELRGGQGVSQVARWIVNRDVLSMDWQGSLWIPAFQLCPASRWPWPSLARVLEALPPEGGDWEWTDWFAQANEALAGHRPADLLAVSPAEVVQAARLLRFVRMG